MFSWCSSKQLSWSIKSYTLFSCNMHKLFKIHPGTIRDTISSGLQCMKEYRTKSPKCPIHISTKSTNVPEGVIRQPFSRKALSAIIILSLSKQLSASALANSFESLNTLESYVFPGNSV